MQGAVFVVMRFTTCTISLSTKDLLTSNMGKSFLLHTLPEAVCVTVSPTTQASAEHEGVLAISRLVLRMCIAVYSSLHLWMHSFHF